MSFTSLVFHTIPISMTQDYDEATAERQKTPPPFPHSSPLSPLTADGASPTTSPTTSQPQPQPEMTQRQANVVVVTKRARLQHLCLHEVVEQDFHC